MKARVFSETVCILGEGPLWHPERAQLFWFDILGKRLLTRTSEGEQIWQFDECVSAAGRVDRETLIMASATALWRFEIETGVREKLTDLEADNPVTRSNDGRADPFGGFWIGTMGYNAEPGAGAIYRYFRGELRRLYQGITVSNAISFSPDGHFACYTDSRDRRVMKQALDGDGWPAGEPEVFLDLRQEKFNADGAVMDAEGRLWNAQWGAGRVACYTPDGRLTDTFAVPTAQSSCPAFGGPDLTTLFVTTAAEGLTDDPMAGKTFCIETNIKGQAEHRVVL